MPSLTRTQAAERSALLDVCDYLVELDLTTGDTVFRSRTTIRFSARDGARTFLDLQPETLRSVELNGHTVDVDTWSAGRLPLTGLAEDNELIVVADMRYSRECEGLHRYVDPVDDAVYVYAFVYLDNAPRVFACFDQPDLKARYRFEVRTPADWQVLGNSESTQVRPGHWQLALTPPQASYLTTVLAGPYQSRYQDHDGVRLGFHCRASLARYVDVDVAELFEVTGQCLDAYRDLFGVGYPFGKLDHVFVPEFSLLSLDHPGCVLLRELYLFRTPGTASERETRAVVLAHGISLMWLAALVTHAWWDDFWLGQSLADYLAHRITSEATRFNGPPTTFAARRKGQAYLADQRVSTHPVSLAAPDVQTVLLEMDRISYFKGHSVIRQLAARVGTEALRAGLRSYFGRHAYRSATYADFMAALGDAAGDDLTDWGARWFERCNVNVLYPEVTVIDGVITDAAIRQAAPASHPVLRPHTLQVGLYRADATTLVTVRIDGERTRLPELIGLPAPDFLLLNAGDLTYAKTRFDEGSLTALSHWLFQLAPIDRAMVWCQLLLAVQDGELTAAPHLDLVIGMIGVETELSIMAEVLEQARYDVADRFLPPAERAAWLDRIAAALRARLAVAGPGAELSMTLYRNLIEFSADVEELRGWLAGTAVMAGIEPDADLAWRLRYRLAVLGALSESDIDAAQAADPSAHGSQFAAKARAARPDSAAKAAAWQAITRDTDRSSYEIWALAEGFWQPEQLALTAPYVQRFFEEMPAAAQLRGDLVLDVLVRFLYPRLAATSDTLRWSEDLLGREDLPVPLRRRVLECSDDLSKVVSAREAAGRGGAEPQVGIGASVAGAVPMVPR